jgi:hypothetical protein
MQRKLCYNLIGWIQLNNDTKLLMEAVIFVFINFISVFHSIKHITDIFQKHNVERIKRLAQKSVMFKLIKNYLVQYFLFHNF